MYVVTGATGQLETSSQKVSYPKARRFGWLAGILTT